MKYLPFDLEAFDYQNQQGRESFRVRVTGSPDGGTSEQEADAPRDLPENLRQRLRQLEDRQLSFPEVVRLGEDLAALLFPPGVRRLWERSRAKLNSDEWLRIRLKLNWLALADIPWEYVYLPADPNAQPEHNNFLALQSNVSLTRYEIHSGSPKPPAPIGPGGPARLLGIVADPDLPPEYPPLQLAQEVQKITDSLAKFPYLKLDIRADSTVGTFLDSLEDNAQIFLFAGHGGFEGETALSRLTHEAVGHIVLLGEEENGRRTVFKLNADRLRLNLVSKGVRLAVLGACLAGRRNHLNPWSGIAPALTRIGIPAVVGMQFTIRDSNTLLFGDGFYRTLGRGGTIDEAVVNGRKRIVTINQSNDERDWGVPVLYLRGDEDEGVLFPELGEQADQRLDRRLPSFNVGGSVSGVPTLHETPPPPKLSYFARLRNQISERFGEEDLQSLSEDLGVQYGDLPGTNKTRKAASLVDRMMKENRLEDLLARCRELRPRVEWPDEEAK